MIEFTNCKVHIKDDVLYAQIPLKKGGVGMSASGKSFSYGTTNGIKEVAWNDIVLKVNVNINSKNPKYVVTAEDKAEYKRIYEKR